MADFTYDYTIYANGEEIIQLRKGMTKEEVLSILGQPTKSENCKNMSNEKLVFKFVSRHVVTRGYTILFTREQLVYVISR